MVTEKDQEERTTQRNAQKEHFPKVTAWEMRGANFHEFLQLVGLNDWSFKSLGLAGIEP